MKRPSRGRGSQLPKSTESALCIQAWKFIPYQIQIPSRSKAKESEKVTYLNGYIYPSILIHTVTVTLQSSLGEKSMSRYHSQLQSFESLHLSQLAKLRAGLHGSEVLHGTPLKSSFAVCPSYLCCDRHHQELVSLRMGCLFQP